MLTLSYGFKKPQTGDKGSAFFPALEDNIQQLNDHTHDGSDSPRLDTSSVEALTSSVPAGSWVAQGDGVYRQLVTMPGGITYGEVMIGFLESPAGHIAMLGVEKVSASTFYVYCTDNAKSFTAVYSS
jgi:hypothetical protein